MRYLGHVCVVLSKKTQRIEKLVSHYPPKANNDVVTKKTVVERYTES